jgi:hypothetical protein
MMVALSTLDGIVVKIMSSKKLAQMIIYYFVSDTLVLAKR